MPMLNSAISSAVRTLYSRTISYISVPFEKLWRNQVDTVALFKAARLGDFDTINTFISKSFVDVNVLNNAGSTLLHHAVICGQTAIVRQLITESQANANIADRRGNTPLHSAASEGNIDVISTLITEGGAEVNVSDNKGRTPLHEAAHYGKTQAINLLINTGRADINVIDQLGRTPIVLAFENGHHDIVAILQQHGAQLPEHLRAQGNDINGNQSVHEVSVHVSVSNSIRALKEYYQTADLVSARKELLIWAEELKGDDSITQAAKRCITRLKDINFIDERSGVPMQEALGLVWLGLNDLAAQEESKVTEKSRLVLIAERRQALIQALYEIQRGYNINNKGIDNGKEDEFTCVSGSFNKLVTACGGGRHVKVNIYFVTPKTITKKLQALVNQEVDKLSEQQKRDYASGWDNTESPKSTYFFEQIKSSLEQKLREEFDNFKNEIKGYDEVIRANIDALDSLPTPKSVIECQEKLAKEAGGGVISKQSKPILHSFRPVLPQAISSVENGLVDEIEAVRVALVA